MAKITKGADHLYGKVQQVKGNKTKINRTQQNFLEVKLHKFLGIREDQIQ